MTPQGEKMGVTEGKACPFCHRDLTRVLAE